MDKEVELMDGIDIAHSLTNPFIFPQTSRWIFSLLLRQESHLRHQLHLTQGFLLKLYRLNEK